jgi:hypothetical protein
MVESGCGRVSSVSLLISCHESSQLLVWKVATGKCNQVFKGHDRVVLALAVCGSSLASCREDWSIKVWGMEAAAVQARERLLLASARPYQRGSVTGGIAGQAGELG